MATEKYRISTEREGGAYVPRYGGMRPEEIDRIHPSDRKSIEESHVRVLEGNSRLRSITSEVELVDGS